MIRHPNARARGGYAALACAVLSVAVMTSGQATTAALPQQAQGPADVRAPQRTDAGPAAPGAGVRVFSWNLSSDAFVKDPAAFRAVVRQSRADILLLDEVSPSTNAQQIRTALAGLAPDGPDQWHIDFGASGGRQRGVIVSRLPLERLAEFSDIVPYPADDRRRLADLMVAAGPVEPAFSMDGGIPMNGVVVLAGQRRLLVVTTDMQCCGNDPGSWQEDRRRVEAGEIRRRIRQVLERTRVDGLIVGGDFNLVSTPLPLVIVSGPYRLPHAGLLVAELRHLDGADTWTWDGRGTPFPSRPMDFVLYSPHTLALRQGYVLDTADLPQSELEQLGIQPESAGRLSAHRPLVAEFVWH
ncbi:endonuclease/exonuclease/phosphatase family protein [Luteitalea pratensis]|uniref:endonuclease/exonuclease/phosphatase family protein n=1 Tax=Luteitalea pratensis TaxID=1855912 RepID=UPI0012FF831D|nr:endonuclease/exonuclease/phosphatase family protein [Luteitalea pratensis]